MNREIANALSGYFETLYEINQRFLFLCGTSCLDNDGKNLKTLLDMVQDLFRLLPFSYDKESKSLFVKKEDGLIEFDKEIGFLYQDYNEILQNHYDDIDVLRKVRNKYEHKMHSLKELSSEDGTSVYFAFDFEIIENGTTVNKRITYGMLVGTIKDLNYLFFKLQNEV